MFGIKVQITKCVNDECYPSFVECQFTDAYNEIQIFNDKSPVFTTKSLDGNSDYPTDGIIGCEVLERSDSFIKVSTKIPWHVESIAGKFLFMVKQRT